MNLRNPQASAGLEQARSAGLAPWVCSLALLAFAPLSHAQSGVVVIQIRVTAPTCAVPAGQTSDPSALPVQLDPRCRLASVITQTPAPQTSAGATGTQGNTVVQISYQ